MEYAVPLTVLYVGLFVYFGRYDLYSGCKINGLCRGVVAGRSNLAPSLYPISSTVEGTELLIDLLSIASFIGLHLKVRVLLKVTFFNILLSSSFSSTQRCRNELHC